MILRVTVRVNKSPIMIKLSTHLFYLQLLYILTCCIMQCNSSAYNNQKHGWRMVDRFSGIRFEIHLKNNSKATDTGIDTDTATNTDALTTIMKQAIRRKADQLACFGWVQDSPTNRTLVGEARCNKNMGFHFKRFLQGDDDGGDDDSHDHASFDTFIDHVIIKDYEDTMIKLHFSHFKILDSRRETCFRDHPHMCKDNLVDLL